MVAYLNRTCNQRCRPPTGSQATAHWHGFCKVSKSNVPRETTSEIESVVQHEAQASGAP